MNILYYEIIFILTLLPNSFTFLVALVNLIFNQTLKPRIKFDENILISILIPMRNEENNIPKLLDSLKSQNYQNFEIIILDDNSSDNSFDIASNYINKFDNLQVLKGKELPQGWLGKNWACHQLSLQAKGKYLIFIDADVILNSTAINTLLSYIYKYNLKSLSVFPTQIMNSFGEKLVLPLMNWVLLSFLPLVLVRLLHFKSLVAANGQLFVFHRDTYFKIGGHEMVKNQPVEDMELARLIKSNGLKIGTFLGGKLVSCNMYDDFVSSILGFSKNFYKGFNTHWTIFLLIIGYIAFFNLIPFVLVFYKSIFIIPILLIISTRIILSILSNQKITTNTFLHIPQFIVFLLIGILSVYKTKFGKNVWKGRQI